MNIPDYWKIKKEWSSTLMEEKEEKKKGRTWTYWLLLFTNETHLRAHEPEESYEVVANNVKQAKEIGSLFAEAKGYPYYKIDFKYANTSEEMKLWYRAKNSFYKDFNRNPNKVEQERIQEEVFKEVRKPGVYKTEGRNKILVFG